MDKHSIKVGFAEDPTGNATERLEIVNETRDGLLVVRHFTVLEDLYNRPFIVRSSLQLRRKDEVKDIREVEIDETS